MWHSLDGYLSLNLAGKIGRLPSYHLTDIDFPSKHKGQFPKHNRYVLFPVGGQYSLGLVVAGQPVDPAFDQNQAKLGISVLQAKAITCYWCEMSQIWRYLSFASITVNPIELPIPRAHQLLTMFLDATLSSI